MKTLDQTVREVIKTLEKSVEKKIKSMKKNDKIGVSNNPNEISVSKNIRSEVIEPIVPRDPQLFYKYFGLLPHPFKKDSSGRPLPSPNLAPYQVEAWKHQGNLLVIKSNKIGMTTSFLLEDIQSRLLPDRTADDGNTIN